MGPMSTILGGGDYSANIPNPMWEAVAPTYGKIPYGDNSALAQMILGQGMPGWSRPARDTLTGNIRGYMRNTPGYRTVPDREDFQRAVRQLEAPIIDPGYEPPFPRLRIQPRIDRLGNR